MRRKLVLAGLVVLAAGGGLVAIVWNRPEVQAIVALERLEQRLKSDAVFGRAAPVMARYAQTLEGRFGDRVDEFGTGWLPAELTPVPAHYVTFDENGLRIEMGGGFHHFGYFVARDDATSTATEKVWEFEFYTETERGRKTVVRLPADERVPDDEIVTAAIAGYDAQMATVDARELPQELRKEVCFLRHMGRMDLAAAACAAAIERVPEHWLPRIGRALLESPHSPGPAARAFREWVEAQPSYSHYFYLACLYDKLGDPQAAADAVARMLDHPALTTPLDDVSVTLMGHNGAILAYRARRYDVAERLCARMLEEVTPDSNGESLRRIRESAAAALAGTTTRSASGAPIPAPANLFALLPLDVLIDEGFIGAGVKAESQPISGPQP